MGARAFSPAGDYTPCLHHPILPLAAAGAFWPLLPPSRLRFPAFPASFSASSLASLLIRGCRDQTHSDGRTNMHLLAAASLRAGICSMWRRAIQHRTGDYTKYFEWDCKGHTPPRSGLHAHLHEELHSALRHGRLCRALNTCCLPLRGHFLRDRVSSIFGERRALQQVTLERVTSILDRHCV